MTGTTPAIARKRHAQLVAARAARRPHKTLPEVAADAGARELVLHERRQPVTVLLEAREQARQVAPNKHGRIAFVGLARDVDARPRACGMVPASAFPRPRALAQIDITGADPVCGDGNAVESDNCLSNCTRAWLVFVTSGPYTQGDLQGLVGADYECRHRATKLFLPNGERYMAWVSTSETQPVDRLYHARGPYRLVDGETTAPGSARHGTTTGTDQPRNRARSVTVE